MRLSALILLPLCIWLASCGSSAQLAQPEIRTVTYDGSDWGSADIDVTVTPAAAGWRVDVASTAEQPAGTLLLELRFDRSLAAHDAVATCPQSELSLLAAGKPGGVGLGVIMPKGESIQPGALLSFTLAPAARTSSEFLNRPQTYVDNLVAIVGEGFVDLSWSYKLTGDYDQNSEVNIADLSALGPRLGNSTFDGVEDGEDYLVDGDGNGLITLADITPIGANFLTMVSGYEVFSATAEDVQSATVTSAGTIDFDASTVTPDTLRLFEYVVTDPARLADAYFFVAAQVNLPEAESFSNVVYAPQQQALLFAVPPPGQSTIDPNLSQAPSLVLLTGNGAEIEDGAPLVAFATTAGALHLARYRDGAWESVAVGSSTYALPQLYADGSSFYVIVYDIALQKVVSMSFDATLTVTGGEDVTPPLTGVPTQMSIYYEPATGPKVAIGISTPSSHEVWYSENTGGGYSTAPVSSGADTLAGLTLSADSTGEPWLFFTHGTIDTSTAFELNFTLVRAERDGGGFWGTTDVAYPDSPMQCDLRFTADDTPKLAFTAARDTTFPIPPSPITVSLSFDGVVGTLDGSTWSFEKYFDSTLDLGFGGGFPPTTATLDLAMDLENHWAREGELSYTVGNGGVTFDIATFAPQSGSLDGEARYADDSGGTFSDNNYFDGAAGLSQSWDEQGTVHGVAYLEFVPLDTTQLLAGEFNQDSSLLFWRK